jgi:hypothetical protein
MLCPVGRRTCWPKIADGISARRHLPGKGRRVKSYSATFWAEQSAAADCLQRPLLRRCRFRQRLSRSVDMTSDVKGCSKFFMSSSQVPISSCRQSAGAEPVETTVDHADIRGLATTLLASVRCLPRSRDEDFEPLHAVEDYTTPGLCLCRRTAKLFSLPTKQYMFGI